MLINSRVCLPFVPTESDASARNNSPKSSNETPQIHRINRASWSLKTLAQALEKQYGQPIDKSTLSEHVIAEGYTFKKARRVLTSPDPHYREKLQEITCVLLTLRDDEKFFSTPFEQYRNDSEARDA
jgi:hypothetical protein